MKKIKKVDLDILTDNLIRIFFILGFLWFVTAIFYVGIHLCNKVHTYDRPATVTHVWGEEVVCVDQQGQEWKFFGDGFKTGQEIVLKMDDMETIGINDDIIVDVNK